MTSRNEQSELIALQPLHETLDQDVQVEIEDSSELKVEGSTDQLISESSSPSQTGKLKPRFQKILAFIIRHWFLEVLYSYLRDGLYTGTHVGDRSSGCISTPRQKGRYL